MLRAPFSSEFDPSEEAEGSIDPLGLQPGYERLADRLLPAVTVRMGHPRFVTAMAVGACVCDDWDTDAVAADEITPPWLVWEWFVIEAFVRAEDSLSGISGIPGIQKVRRALRNQRPVSATAYLKTPSAFGFTGAERIAFVLQCAMPVAVFNYLFAQMYDNEPGEVASLVVISTLLAVVTTPIVLALLVP